MRNLLISIVVGILLFASCKSSNQEYKITSPDHCIEVCVSKPVAEEPLVYSVTYNGRVVIEPSALGVSTGEPDKGALWKIGRIQYSEVEDNYTLTLGKSKHVESRCREMTMEMQTGSGRKIQVTFRAFDDGVAFRYTWLSDGVTSDDISVTDEWSHFRLAGDPKATVLCFPNYTSSHETNYTVAKLSSIPNDTLVDLPALFELSDSVLIAVTEANLTDYPGMYLSKNGHGTLFTKLSPLPDGSGVKAKMKAPHHSPWRVLMIGKNPATLIESNIILNLNEPCAIDDVSWIKPNKSTWHWWCATGVPKNAPFKRGMNFETMKYYIDFASENGISCHSLTDVDSDSWYTSPKDTYPQPGEGTDVTKPNPALQMDKLLEYARSKNVRIRLWVHWKALAPKLEEAFALYEKWGIEGLMVDYMDRDDQEMVNFYHRVIESAARHKLTIQFHGAYKPTGLRRTYPNLVTTEGVLNLEFLKWSDRCTPQHNVNVAFTRMLAGPLDYHMGGFHSVTRKDFKPDFNHPVVMGTRCHIMGMYVVYETYLQLLCDTPEAYTGQPGFDFLLQIPATWDETKVLRAKPGEYIVIARRNGSDWYIGGLNNDTPRDMDISLDFLPDGEYTLEKYADAEDADIHPNHLVREQKTITAKDNIPIVMANGGGVAMRIYPAK